MRAVLNREESLRAQKARHLFLLRLSVAPAIWPSVFSAVLPPNVFGRQASTTPPSGAASIARAYRPRASSFWRGGRISVSSAGSNVSVSGGSKVHPAPFSASCGGLNVCWQVSRSVGNRGRTGPGSARRKSTVPVSGTVTPPPSRASFSVSRTSISMRTPVRRYGWLWKARFYCGVRPAALFAAATLNAWLRPR